MNDCNDYDIINNPNNIAHIPNVSPASPPPESNASPSAFYAHTHPEIKQSPSFNKLRYLNRQAIKRRRGLYSMLLSTGIFFLSSYILIFSKEEQLRLVSISLLSGVSSVWLSNIKYSSKSNDDESV